MTIRVAIAHLDGAISNRRPLLVRFIDPRDEAIPPADLAPAMTVQPGESREVCVHSCTMLQVFEAGVGHPDWDPSRPMPEPLPTKVSREMVEAAITGETYTVLPDGRTTVCQLTLDNGFTVDGQSACVDPANFNAELGDKYARERAFDEAWKMLGFRLADRRAGIR